jgi:hypothetical protein
MVVVVAMEIFFLPSRRLCVFLCIFKIVLICLSLELSQLLIFPSVVDIDGWWHQMFTSSILNAGHVPAGYAYSTLPLFHLLTGSISLVAGLDYKMAAMLSISLTQILCNVLFTFLIGNLLFNKKIGLLGGLLLGISNWHVYYGFAAVPTTIASLFIPAIIYLLLKIKKEKTLTGISLALILMSALILTHTMTSVWMAILLLAFWAGFEIYNRINDTPRTPRLSITFMIPLLFVVGMLSWWSYASSRLITQLAEMIKWGFGLDYFWRYSPMTKEIAQYFFSVPLSEQLFYYAGMVLYFSISLLGCLYMFSKRFGNSNRFVMAFGGVITLSIDLFALVTSRTTFTIRFWYFVQIVLAIPLAVTFFLLRGAARNKLVGSIFLAVLIFSLSFLMILSPVANLDNPKFSPNIQVRFALTESELRALETVSNMENKTIGVDQYYSNLRWSSYTVEDISEQIYSRNYIGCDNILILIRKEIVDHPLQIFRIKYKLDCDPREDLTEQFFSQFYDSGSVSGFIHPW